jgi:hypothetical protein
MNSEPSIVTPRLSEPLAKAVLKDRRIQKAMEALQSIENRNTNQKIRSKKKRRAKAKQARKSRSTNR